MTYQQEDIINEKLNEGSLEHASHEFTRSEFDAGMETTFFDDPYIHYNGIDWDFEAEAEETMFFYERFK